MTWRFNLGCDCETKRGGGLRESHLVFSQQAAFHYFPCWNVYCPTAHVCCSYSLLGSFSCFSVVLGELVETWSSEISFRHRKDWHEPAFFIHTSFHIFCYWPTAQPALGVLSWQSPTLLSQWSPSLTQVLIL